ncbi:hypothetical protein C8J57DRAFT_1227735 [Mycena rebaudengoi]|nr:hypothetical protein C8J57DRAFT_1227735 [Mycena rebaudengoi]
MRTWRQRTALKDNSAWNANDGAENGNESKTTTSRSAGLAFLQGKRMEDEEERVGRKMTGKQRRRRLTHSVAFAALSAALTDDSTLALDTAGEAEDSKLRKGKRREEGDVRSGDELSDGTVMNVNNVITHRHLTKSKVPKYQTMRRQRVVPATLRKRDQRMVLKALKSSVNLHARSIRLEGNWRYNSSRKDRQEQWVVQNSWAVDERRLEKRRVVRRLYGAVRDWRNVMHAFAAALAFALGTFVHEEAALACTGSLGALVVRAMFSESVPESASESETESVFGRSLTPPIVVNRSKDIGIIIPWKEVEVYRNRNEEIINQFDCYLNVRGKTKTVVASTGKWSGLNRTNSDEYPTMYTSYRRVKGGILCEKLPWPGLESNEKSSGYAKPDTQLS